MADYYPLLARAVAGLKTSTPEARHAIYERARGALIGQLRGMNPPVPEPDILRESAALDAAVARIEADCARSVENETQKAAEEAKKAQAAQEAQEADRRAQEARREEEARREAQKAEDSRRSEAEARRLEEERKAREERLALEERLATEERVALEKRMAEEARRAADARKAQEAEKLRAVQAAQLARESEIKSAEARVAQHRAPDDAAADAPGAPNPPSTPLATRKPAARKDDAFSLDAGRDLDAPDGPAFEGPRLEADARARAARPAAPTPPVERSSNMRYVVVGATLALVMGAIGATAWVLRDRPDGAARAPAAPSAPKTDAAEAGGKIADRAGAQPSAPVPTVSVPTQPIRPQGEQAPQPATSRAAFLIQNLQGPEPHTVYSGTAVWRSDNGVWRADVTVPDIKLTASFALSKNAEQGPASHNVEIRLDFADPAYKVGQIGAPEMRREDSPYGDKVAGVAVQVTPTFFLVGLRRSDADITYNLELIRSRGWIDLPMEMSDKRIAKLTIEKGPAGDAAFAAASKGW
jgi:actin-related protein